MGQTLQKTGNTMRENTLRRYRRIRSRYKQLLGTGSVMHIYYQLADEFDLSMERIRQIIALTGGNK